MNSRQTCPALRAVSAPFRDALGKRKLSLTRSKPSRFPVYRVGMHGMTPDEIAMLAVAVFIAGFVAIAVWLLQR